MFRYNPSQADSTVDLLPPQPFAFERPIRTYFDSPTEDPIGSDPLELDDHDPFKLDPEECKNLGFKWAPFDYELRSADIPETNAQSHDADSTYKEVYLFLMAQITTQLTHTLLLLGHVRFPGANRTDSYKFRHK